MATTAGYHVIGIGSDYLATERLAGADSCFCRQYGLDEIEQSALALTPLGALPIDRWTYDAHRRKVSESFGALESTAAQSGAKFVFAHIITPHPPFVFHADGRPRDPLQGVVFSFADGDHYRGTRGTYLEGYRQQVQFATRQLMTLIERLLAQPEPTPVIVIHGDHGPGSILRWEHRGGTSFRERLSIFAAYRFPGGDAAVYSTITPVNGMRMLANRYFGTSLPLLPDKSFFSKWSRPYEFIPNDSTAVDARTN